jgi:hypothetical protein
VGLEWGPLSVVSTIEELLGRKSSGSSLENEKYGRRDPSPDHWTPSLYNHLLRGVPSGLFHTTNLLAILFSPFILHALAIASSLPWQKTNYEPTS